MLRKMRILTGVLAVYLVMSGITLLMFWIDKRAAMKGRWRVPESTLHLLEFLCGFPGALLGQRWLRHKSYKRSYRMVLWLIIGMHAAFWTWWLSLR